MKTASPEHPRVALYARVSTVGKGQDVTLQLDELRRVAEQRGWRVYQEYVDDGISGSIEKRPALDRMMADAQAGKFDLVAVWKLDRLGRSLQHLLRLLADLGRWGVGFASLRDAGIDTTTPTGRLMLQILGALAEYERELIRERVNAGIAHAKALGKHCGRPKVDLELRPAAAMLKEGRGVREVAKILGVCRSTLRRRLQETGTWPWAEARQDEQAA